MNIKGAFKVVKSFVIKHGPDILTIMGTTGLIASGIIAVNQTPKVAEIIKEKEEETGEELTPKEKVKECWKLYLPSIMLTTSSVACIFCARRIDSKRMTALVAAYQMSEGALIRLKDSIKDELGEKKLAKIEEKSDIKMLEENPINPDNIVNTGDGNDLFCDYYSGGYFRSSTEAIKARYNHWISKLQRNDYLSLNSWITELELRPMGDDVGDELGFTSTMYHNKDLDDEPIFEYGPGYLGAPCAIVKLSCKPSIDYMYSY